AAEPPLEHVGGSRPDALTVYGHKKTSHSSDFYFLVQEMGGSSFSEEPAPSFYLSATSAHLDSSFNCAATSKLA
ncbi:hypothetical protein, partial [Slackia isoflavoniconvertens]|uniref:hypothetical protein n=1 Tax=Slackia isoflavoniconvertens TaxID=572010 RepID=UPI002E7601F3